MICQRCLLRLSRRQAFQSARAFSSTPRSRQATPVSAQTTTGTNPRPNDRPAATATPGVSQPFSVPLSPRVSKQDLPIKAKQTKSAAKLPASSVPAGTVLKGLNFMKNQQDPVAKEDSEYPPWLWTVLEKKKDDDAAAAVEGDLYAKSKKQRQKAAKALRRQQLLSPESLAPKIPLYEQSIDLPAGDSTLEGALEAGEARHELTKAMRDQRRKKIKEDNYLRGMR
ncbi:hypothetical protein EJ03DRAFT_341107 [Teratosphaeria nubilosa]|uniref:Large ribosomal subunit protein mL54 n=1 Tax=Teratosphaeria nubilosa TaxID=161662 RepID=A0A6G1LK53_9PEZI|nr:hypothetical protein EJ03DRAFT_341107 [Teratosphaeria nubilosa]